MSDSGNDPEVTETITQREAAGAAFRELNELRRRWVYGVNIPSDKELERAYLKWLRAESFALACMLRVTRRHRDELLEQLNG